MVRNQLLTSSSVHNLTCLLRHEALPILIMSFVGSLYAVSTEYGMPLGLEISWATLFLGFFSGVEDGVDFFLAGDLAVVPVSGCDSWSLDEDCSWQEEADLLRSFVLLGGFLYILLGMRPGGGGRGLPDRDVIGLCFSPDAEVLSEVS
uniref:Uncharacterized protein n=1 Tax=Cacopsylla melanoneura TaxID=428564 RepID=A0A8D8XKQ3_9HEMI